MNRNKKNSQSGIALLVVLFALILVAAIGLAMMFASNGDTGLNGSYRQSNLAYFAARSGVEELRDRMHLASTDPTSNGNGVNEFLPALAIGQPASVLYITNANVDAVAPWDSTNAYFDDELCHEVANSPANLWAGGAPNKPCGAAQIPPGNAWYVQKNAEVLPGGASLTYKWARINLKLNESTSPWCVLLNGPTGCNPQQPTGAPPDAAADQVCYNGQNEFVLSDLKTPIDVPGRLEGQPLPTQLAAMYMYGGGSTGHGNSGHSTTSTTSGTSTTGTASTSGSTTGTTSGTTSATTSGTTTATTSGTTTGTTSATTTSGTTTSGTTTSATTTSGTTTATTSATTTSGTTTSGTTTATTSATTTSGTTTSATTTSGTTTSGTTTGGTGTTTGGGPSPAPSCGVNSPPLPGTPFGVSTTAVQAVSCKAVESEPVYMLTSLAVSPTGARRMVQYEVARIPIPPVPAALTIAGPLTNPIASNSNNYFIDGHDAAYDPVNQCGGMNKPAVGTISDTGNTDATNSMNNFINAVPASRLNNYTGADGCSPDVQNVNGISNSMYSTPQGLQGLVQSVEGAATQTYNSNPTITNWGTATNPEVIVVNGDMNISAATGYGVLLVTGSLTFSGNFAWNGLVLVVGQGELHESGGGNKGITGALMLAKIGNANYSTNPTDGNLLTQLGSPIYDYPGGGTAGFKYDSCVIKSITGKSNFTVLARREITY